MSCDKFSLVSLKISFLVLVVLFGLHVTGFSMTLWSNVQEEKYEQIKYMIGLWEICTCLPRYIGVCYCQSIFQAPAPFTVVQVLETVGLVGLIASGILTCIILFTNQDKGIKFINIVIAFISGALIVTGAIVYALNYYTVSERLYDLIDPSTDILDFETLYTVKPSPSFILCTIAGSLCIIGFAPLLVFNLCTARATSQAERQLQSVSVQNHDQTSPVTGLTTISTNVHVQ